MLTLTIPASDNFEEVELDFEHSLVSISKWEARHEKPFFTKEIKSENETLDYVVQMLRSDNAPKDLGSRLTYEHLAQVQHYINSAQTATTFRQDPNAPKSREIITSELVYYWLTAFNIAFSPCEDWHFNRLMTLVQICGIKQTKPKPMNRQAQAEQYRQLNAQRRKDLGTSG